MIIVIAGPPASGKDTQAELLADRLQGIIISPGALLRAEAVQDPALAAQLKRGDLADDDHVDEIIGREMLKHKNQTLILDGTPRHLPQVTWLGGFLKQHFSDTTAVGVRLKVAEVELRERAAQRKRSDDDAAAFEHRLDIYRKEIIPALDALQTVMPVLKVNGEGSVMDIHQQIVDGLQQKGFL